MNVRLEKSELKGELDFFKIAPSKSILHRQIIASALSGSEMPYFNSDDIRATYGVMQHILTDKKDCNVFESGSTLRFLIPLSVLLGGRRFVTSGRLAKRPLYEYSCMKNARITTIGNKISTSGSIESGTFTLRGDISSQFVTGLMFALPLLDGDSKIVLSTPLESKAYCNQTISVLKDFGISVFETEYGFFIPGNQKYAPCAKKAEGDWSYAAFYIVANELGSRIRLDGLNYESLASDKKILELINLDSIDISQCPDLFPILCINACKKTKPTVIYNAKRLKYKESDRLIAMYNGLSALGADVNSGDDSITINGCGSLSGGTVNSYNDHRIAMAFSIAALCLCKDAVTVLNAECVKKSCPDFFSHLKGLGAKFTVT